MAGEALPFTFSAKTACDCINGIDHNSVMVWLVSSLLHISKGAKM